MAQAQEGYRSQDQVGLIRYRVVVPGSSRITRRTAMTTLSRLASLRAFIACMADEDFVWRDEADLPRPRRWAGTRKLLARLLENPRLIPVVIAPSFEVVKQVGAGDSPPSTGSAVSGLSNTWVSRAAGLWGVELHNLDFDVELALVRRPRSFEAYVPFATFRPTSHVRASRAPKLPVRPGIELATPKGMPPNGESPDVLARAYFAPDGPWTELHPVGRSNSRPQEHSHASLLHGTLPVTRGNGKTELLAGLEPSRAIWPSALWSTSAAARRMVSPQPRTHRLAERGAWIGATTSWYHFIVEGLCAYLSIEELAGGRIPICIQSGTPTQIRELALEFTGVEPIVCGPYEEVRFDSLWITDIPVLRRKEDLDEEAVVRVAALRQALESRVPSYEDSVGKRYYFYRGTGTLRRLRNQREVAGILKGRGFEPIEAGTLDLEQQTAILRGAESVVMESGAAFAGLLFCAQGTRVLEIGPRTEGTGFWGEFAHGLGLRHVGVWSPGLLSAGRFRTPGAVGYRISGRALVDGLDQLGV